MTLDAVLIFFWLFLLLRIIVATIHSLARVDEVFEYNMKLVDNNTYWKNKVDYDSNADCLIRMIDIRKWTYKQFFPKRAGEK